MAITYPLTPPTNEPKQVAFDPLFSVAANTSPFTFEEEFFENMGQQWRATVQLPPLVLADGEEWVAFQLALNGRLGTFLLGDPANTSPRGTVSGSLQVAGAGQQRSKVLTVKGGTVGETILAGDYIQLPNNRLHKVLVDATIDGSGLASLDVFPRVRDILVDSASIATSNTVGIWRLAENIAAWDIGEAKIYGINFKIVEAI